MFATKSKKPAHTTASAAPAQASFKPETTAPDHEQVNGAHQDQFQNVIGKGTVIEGNIIAEGDLVIEGTIRGDVTTKTTLIVGPSCVIEGNILADRAEVAGQVKGTVQALGILIIKSSSTIDGDVLTKNLNVESGSTFNGRFTVGSVTSTAAGANQKVESSIAKPDVSVAAGDARRPTAVGTSAPSKV